MFFILNKTRQTTVSDFYLKKIPIYNLKRIIENIGAVTELAKITYYNT